MNAETPIARRRIGRLAATLISLIAASAVVLIGAASPSAAVPGADAVPSAPTLASEFPICPDCFTTKLVRRVAPLLSLKTVAPPIPVCPDCWAPRLVRQFGLFRS